MNEYEALRKNGECSPTPPRSCALETEIASVYEHADRAVHRLQDLIDRLAL